MLDKNNLNRYSLLVAESNPWDRRQISSMLRSAGATDIQLAGDGSEALKAIEYNTPDLAIVGERLSFLNGRELVRAIRRHDDKPVNHLPVLFVVNQVNRKDMASLARIGVHEVICKPFSTKTLTERIYWTIMAQRPFIRMHGYFGPEPRGRFWKRAIGIENDSSPAPRFLSDDLSEQIPVEPEPADVIEI